MGDTYINTGASSLGAGAIGALTTLFADSFVTLHRARGNPLDYVSTDLSTEFATKGYVVNVPIYSAVTSSTLSDDGSSAIVKDDTTGSKAAITLNTFRYVSFGISEVASAVLGSNAVVEKLIQVRLAGLMDGIETDLLSPCSSWTTNVVGTYTTDLTKPVIVAAYGKLMGQKIPAGVPIHGFLDSSAHAWQAFSQLTEVQTSSVRGNVNEASPVFEQNYGTASIPAFGVNWHMCQTVPGAGTGSVSNAAFAAGALAFASRPIQEPQMLNGVAVVSTTMVDPTVGLPLSVRITYDAATMSERVVIGCLYGTGTADQSYGVLVKS